MRPYHVDEVLITPRQLEKRVDDIARELAAGVQSDNLVVIGILRGSFIFLADLVRWFTRSDLHPRIDLIIMESYGSGTTAMKEPKVTRDCPVDLTGADVVVVDDILDTGRTLQKAVAHLKARGPPASAPASCSTNRPAGRFLSRRISSASRFRMPSSSATAWTTTAATA